MKIFLRTLLSVFSVGLLLSTTPSAVRAQSSFPLSSSEVQDNSHIGTDGNSISTTRDGGATNGFPVPILPEWAKEPTPKTVKTDLLPDNAAEWAPTDSPKSSVIAGEMRSDREKIPDGFTKEQADLAEIKEARLHNEDNPTLNSGPGCQVYWPSPFEVCGAIRELYDSLGGPRSFLTFPKSNELTNPDGTGKRSEFVNGFIYWHPETGAHTVSIPATVVWSANGWERGHFGYPMTNDIPLGDSWYKQQYKGGYIYTRNSIPAV